MKSKCNYFSFVSIFLLFKNNELILFIRGHCDRYSLVINSNYFKTSIFGQRAIHFFNWTVFTRHTSNDSKIFIIVILRNYICLKQSLLRPTVFCFKTKFKVYNSKKEVQKATVTQGLFLTKLVIYNGLHWFVILVNIYK
jgi:hypothetical protein